MDKRFNFKKQEDQIYQAWEKAGCFNPDKIKKINPKLGSKRRGESSGDNHENRFVVMMPPPNVTGTLHIGHASMLAIEDLMTRFARMQGKETLYLPGTDHAAIATQNKVEKELLKTKKKTRHDLGREKFLKEIEKFVDKSKDTIHNQVRRIGTSCDWSHEAYTMDGIRNKTVKLVFKMMYTDGLIYQGERIVNWCPRCHSTLADDEVDYEEQKAPLYTFKYSPEVPIEIATTRPETKLGDTAIAVNPKDKRYAKYVGRTFKVNFLGIPLNLKIIADRQIDMNFGTGALGVTPAHSAVDWQMAEENKLPVKKVIDENGRIRKGFGEFSEKDVMTARKMIVEKLKKAQLLRQEDEIDNSLSVCYRCGTPIEPLPSKQWFVDVNKKVLKGKNGQQISLKERALEVVKKKEIEIIPKRFNKNYFNWMENLRDWCISRQIWFGHRIPVWYCGEPAEADKNKAESVQAQAKNATKPPAKGCGKIFVGLNAPKACPKCGNKKLIQDPDTLDTWFSSGTWSFSTLFKNEGEVKLNAQGYLAKNKEQQKYHPNSILETGYDILFFWVARMILLSTYAMREVPFEKIYLHGLVKDKLGRKMSKSLDNGIDPLDMIEKYGADATRLSLLIGNTPGNDLRVYEEKISGLAKFITKFFNISRFIVQQQPAQSAAPADKKSVETAPVLALKDQKLTAIDHYILNRYQQLIKEVTADLTLYNFSAAGEKLKDFTWNDLADWYLEVAKIEKGKEMLLRFILTGLTKMWHPFIPFVTEAVWAEIKSPKDSFLVVSPFPEVKELPLKLNAKTARDFEMVVDLIGKVRKIRNLYKVPPKTALKLDFKSFFTGESKNDSKPGPYY